MPLGCSAIYDDLYQEHKVYIQTPSGGPSSRVDWPETGIQVSLASGHYNTGAGPTTSAILDTITMPGPITLPSGRTVVTGELWLRLTNLDIHGGGPDLLMVELTLENDGGYGGTADGDLIDTADLSDRFFALAIQATAGRDSYQTPDPENAAGAPEPGDVLTFWVHGRFTDGPPPNTEFDWEILAVVADFTWSSYLVDWGPGHYYVPAGHKVSPTAPAGWELPGFNDAAWALPVGSALGGTFPTYWHAPLPVGSGDEMYERIDMTLDPFRSVRTHHPADCMGPAPDGGFDGGEEPMIRVRNANADVIEAYCNGVALTIVRDGAPFYEIWCHVPYAALQLAPPFRQVFALRHAPLRRTTATPNNTWTSRFVGPINGLVVGVESYAWVYANTGMASDCVLLWGADAQGELPASDPTTVGDVGPMVSPLFDPALVGGPLLVQVALADEFGVGLDDAGKVWTWGKYGPNPGDVSAVPIPVPNTTGTGQLGDTDPISVVRAGDDFAVAVAYWGRMFGWGSNAQNQFHLGAASAWEPTPRPITVANAWDVVAGTENAYLVQGGGSIYAFGSGVALGTATPFAPDYGVVATHSYFDPLLGINTANLTKVIAGDRWAGALYDGDGDLWTWGEGLFGKLASGGTADEVVPVLVLTGVRDAAAGRDHGIALMADYSLRGWGHNDCGQVGDGTTTDRHAPVALGTPVPISYTYADAAARLAASGFLAGDVGKLAVQSDSDSLWRLDGYSPIVWTTTSAEVFAGNGISGAMIGGYTFVWGDGSGTFIGGAGSVHSPQPLNWAQPAYRLVMAATGALGLTECAVLSVGWLAILCG